MESDIFTNAQRESRTEYQATAFLKKTLAKLPRRHAFLTQIHNPQNPKKRQVRLKLAGALRVRLIYDLSLGSNCKILYSWIKELSRNKVVISVLSFISTSRLPQGPQRALAIQAASLFESNSKECFVAAPRDESSFPSPEALASHWLCCRCQSLGGSL